MDIVFKCPHCDQELEVDSGGAGSTIECPACSNSITVPAAGEEGAAPAAPPPTAPAAETVASFHKEKHFSVPAHDKPSEALIQKANRPLEVAARDGEKKMRIKTFKRADCQEVGRDKFDEKVSEFLDHVGQDNIISINSINYSGVDMASKAILMDYGVVIVFKG